MTGLNDAFIVLASYTLITSVFTYPLLEDFPGVVAGSGTAWQNLWNIWWVKKALLELRATPYFTEYLFYPAGVSLAFNTLTLLNCFLGLPLLCFFSLTEAYNILVFLSFVLAGYGMFMLADYFLGDKRIAFVCGIIYSFSPYHVHEIYSGHLHTASIQWIPFFILYLMKTLREGGRSPIYAGFFLFIVSLSSWQYMGAAVIYAAFAVAFKVMGEKHDKSRVLGDSARMFAVFAVLVAPFAVPLVSDYMSSDYMVYDPASYLALSQEYSLDLISPLTPNHLNPAIRSITPEKIFNMAEPPYNSLIPVGYTALLIAALSLRGNIFPLASELRNGIKKYFDKKTLPLTLAAAAAFLILAYTRLADHLYSTSLRIAFFAYMTFFLLLYYLAAGKKLGFWTTSTTLFFLMSLGPNLKVMGLNYPLPLPYYFTSLIPVFRIFRAPYRFQAVTMLSIAMLAGFSLKKNLGKKRNHGLLLALAGLIMLLEYAPTPFLVSDAAMPEVYSVIGGDEGDFAVLEIPIMPIFLEGDNQGKMVVYSQPEYYQTFHNKRIVGGYVSRYPQDAIRFLEETPILRAIRHPMQEANGSELNEARDSLKMLGVKYVVLHRDFYDDETLRAVEDLLYEAFGDEHVFNDDKITAYEVYRE